MDSKIYPPPTPETNRAPEKWMVGKLVSFWDDQISGDMYGYVSFRAECIYHILENSMLPSGHVAILRVATVLPLRLAAMRALQQQQWTLG